MRIIYYEKGSELNALFGTVSTDSVPFWGLTLKQFSTTLYEQAAEAMGQEVVFFDSDSVVLANEKLELDITVLTTASQLPLELMSKETEHYLKQRPNILFDVNGTLIGYVDDEGLRKPPVSNEFTGFYLQEVNPANFLSLNKFILGNIQVNSELKPGLNNVTYGTPTLEGQATDSTICAPVLIDSASVVINSYIAPGTVIRNSRIENSEVFGSFVFNSNIESSTVVDSVIGGATIDGMHITRSVLPHHTVINKCPVNRNTRA